MGGYQITGGVIPTWQKVVLYGPEGIGKTTFAASFPGAVLIDLEAGSNHMDVPRMPAPKDWAQLLDEVMWAAANVRGGTLVVDTADAAERMCFDHVCKRRQWGDIEEPGYGKGYAVAAGEFAHLMEALDQVARSSNVVVVAHSQITKFEQPDERASYDRWGIKLAKKDAPLLKEWADALLFVNFEVTVETDRGGKGHARGGSRRVLHCEHAAAWDAKNRYGLPDRMPFDFAEIEPALFGGEPAEEPVDKKQPKAVQEPHKSPQEPEAEKTEQAPEKPAKNAQGRKERPAATAEQPSQGTPHILDGAKVTEVTPDNVKKLHRLMERDGVNEAQLAMAVNANPRAKYTDADRIADYSAKFVDSLVAHWGSVAKKAHEFDPYHEDYIPFEDDGEKEGTR